MVYDDDDDDDDKSFRQFTEENRKESFFSISYDVKEHKKQN